MYAPGDFTQLIEAFCGFSHVFDNILLSLFQSIFLDLYVKTILSSKDRPPKAATEAFKPLFLEIGHEDFKNTVMPSCIKMLKRNPEIVLQSIGYLLKIVHLDLSKYAMEFLPAVLHQARHSDEERRINALSIIGTLSEKSSDPDALPSMVNAIKAILGGIACLVSIFQYLLAYHVRMC